MINATNMIIAIDFDNTWTEDVELWRRFYYDAQKCGHVVILATGRKYYSDDMARYQLPEDMRMVFCGDDYKEKACYAEGFKVDVWIDDMPGMIQRSLIIGQSDPDDEL